MAELNINIDYESVFLPCYHHLLNDGDKFNSEFFDIEFLYGGRDSGKSRHIAMQLILECMLQPYFKCLLIRKVLNTVRGSQFSVIKSVISKWGLSKLFAINDSRMEIIFIPNGNGFYGKGLDNVDNIKSFDNPSRCWIEEGNQITKEDFVIILTSLRSEERVKTYFSFNPECEMNYTEFWLYEEWFSHTTAYNWSWIKVMSVEIEGTETEAGFNVRATHTTYKNNPYCQPQRKALLESYKGSKNNAYWYQTYTLGLWGYKRTGGEFWKCFEENKHSTDKGYEMGTIHIVCDNNVVPYIAVQGWQVWENRKLARQVKEFACEHPNNTASKAATEVCNWLKRINYKDVVFVYGDPSANARSTEDDEGRSFFDKFILKLQQEGFRANNRVEKSAPLVALSGAFINEIYESNLEGWNIEINVDCRVSIEDYNMAKEDREGKILKKRITDKDTKQSYEKYGHFSDDKRYFITTILKNEFKRYAEGKSKSSLSNQVGYFR